MNKYIIALGIFLIIVAGPLGLFKDFIFSKLGVPSVSDLGDDILDTMSSDERIKDIGRKPIQSARFLENLPWYIFFAGLIVLVIGFFVPP